MSDFPRRIQMQQWCEAERQIYEAMQAVERMAADVRLTDAVVLLGAARDRVADFVDGIEGKRTVPQQLGAGSAGSPAPSEAAIRAAREACVTLSKHVPDWLAEKLRAAVVAMLCAAYAVDRGAASPSSGEPRTCGSCSGSLVERRVWVCEKCNIVAQQEWGSGRAEARASLGAPIDSDSARGPMITPEHRAESSLPSLGGGSSGEGREPEPAYHEIRLDEHGEPDDVVLRCESLHLERLDEGVWWLAAYHGKRRTVLTLSTKRGAPISAVVTENELEAPEVRGSVPTGEKQ